MYKNKQQNNNNKKRIMLIYHYKVIHVLNLIIIYKIKNFSNKMIFLYNKIYKKKVKIVFLRLEY
jgi:hypothetical protein